MGIEGAVMEGWGMEPVSVGKFFMRETEGGRLGVKREMKECVFKLKRNVHNSNIHFLISLCSAFHSGTFHTKSTPSNFLKRSSERRPSFFDCR